jgi:hypothetical protein
MRNSREEMGIESHVYKKSLVVIDKMIASSSLSLTSMMSVCYLTKIGTSMRTITINLILLTRIGDDHTTRLRSR